MTERGRAAFAALALATACAAAPAAGAHYALPPDLGADTHGELTLLRNGRPVGAPRTEPDQEGFEQVRVSADGRTVGWVAALANCCTSYPLPRVLVLLRDDRVLARFDRAPPIFGWAFVPGRDEVVIQQQSPHGPEYLTFTRVRIADGRELARYECDQDERTHAPRPPWSRAVDVPCPDYVPRPEEQ